MLGVFPQAPIFPSSKSKDVPPIAMGGKGAALDLRTFEKVRSKLL